MNGEMLLYGYKFADKVYLNCSERTVFLAEDDYAAVYHIFRFIEKFFQKQNFSDGYLEKGAGLICNGNRLNGSELQVYRIGATLNPAEELKILKKSLMGQIFQDMFAVDGADIQAVNRLVNDTVIKKINEKLGKYQLSYSCGDEGIFDYSKLFTVNFHDDIENVAADEANIYQMKSMMLDMIAELKTRKGKLLLIEYPEYGLSKLETERFFQKIIESSIENIFIYTNSQIVKDYVKHIYCYHKITAEGLCGFDDYDQLAGEIKLLYPDCDEMELEEKAVQALFSNNELTGEMRNFIKNNAKIVING